MSFERFHPPWYKRGEKVFSLICWLSLIVEIWLFILKVIPFQGFNIVALVMFFLLGFATAAYKG